MCDECFLALGEVSGYFCDKAKGIPPYAISLKYASILCGILYVIFCAWLFLTSLLTLDLSFAIISFYLVFGGILMIIGEFHVEWVINLLHFLGNYFGRGVFYVIMGSLTYAVFGLTGVLPILLMIIGGIVMVIGILQIFYYFVGDSNKNAFENEAPSETKALSPARSGFEEI